MSKLEEYEICKIRGHYADLSRGVTINAAYNAVPKSICLFCGSTYWNSTTTVFFEENAPTPPKENNNE